jgi:phosphoadenosine phosphosulfate reductase
VTETSSDLHGELAERANAFERATPEEIVAWTLDRFDGDVSFACSFEDVALLDIVRAHKPDVEVIFLDTEGHFPETYEFVDRLEREWNLNLTRTKPGADAAAWPCGTEECCQRRKVEPLKLAVAGRRAWITSVKRADGPSRASMPIVSWDDKFNLVKVNPFATWTDDDVADYLSSTSVPEHPLWAQGYASIGCAAVTEKPAEGGDRRSGRWAGSSKDECGLHGA